MSGIKLKKITENELTFIKELIDTNPKDAKDKINTMLYDSRIERYSKELFPKNKPFKIRESSVLIGLIIGIVFMFIMGWHY